MDTIEHKAKYKWVKVQICATCGSEAQSGFTMDGLCSFCEHRRRGEIAELDRVESGAGPEDKTRKITNFIPRTQPRR